jgi:hypothetical protein
VQVFRSYGGDWLRLCDLVRASLVFDDMRTMVRCLQLLAEDHEVRVLWSDEREGKMRLDAGYDAVRRSGGYRDVQLCVRLQVRCTGGVAQAC